MPFPGELAPRLLRAGTGNDSACVVKCVTVAFIEEKGLVRLLERRRHGFGGISTAPSTLDPSHCHYTK